jgi:hypothetical protein
MRFSSTGRVATATAVALAAMAGSAARGTDPLPGVADLQKLLADEKYTGAVAGASRLLAATGTAAPAGLDKAQVYAIKADAHLHLRQFSQAADAYTRSSKAASDPVVAATGTAMALLIKRSHSGTYVPRQPGSDGAKPSPIDIVSTEDHQAVLTDLFTDEFAADTAKLTAGTKTATTVPQLQAAAELAALLRQLEVASIGADVKTEPVVMAIASHASDVLGAALQPLSQRVDQIQTAADAPSANGRRWQARSMATGATGGDPTATTGGGGSGPKVGLTAQERSDLQSIIFSAQRIAQAAETLAKTTDEPKGLAASASASVPPAAGGDAAPPADGSTADTGGGGGGGGLAGVSAEANKVVAKATEVLNAKYGRSGTTYAPGTSTGVRGATAPPPPAQ